MSRTIWAIEASPVVKRAMVVFGEPPHPRPPPPISQRGEEVAPDNHFGCLSDKINPTLNWLTWKLLIGPPTVTWATSGAKARQRSRSVSVRCHGYSYFPNPALLPAQTTLPPNGTDACVAL